MKKVNLSFMAIMIISLVMILIVNTMAVFAYRDEVLLIETHKDNMLSINIKYTNLLVSINNNARKYLGTHDEKYKSDFFTLRNSYLNNNVIPTDYRIFTKEQADQRLKAILGSGDFNLASQISYIQFNEAERQDYYRFLNTYHALIGMYTDAVNNNNSAPLTNPYYGATFEIQSNLLTDLCKHYINRMNLKEDEALRNQKRLEYALIGVSLILLCLAAATFYMILRENAYHAYFSKLYNTVVENIDGGIAILDRDYRYDYMNYKYRDILGILTDNPIGKTLHDTFEQNLADTLERATADDPSGEGKFDLIAANRRKSIAYSYYTIEDERGSNKYVHLIRDITRTEELQLQLKKQLAEINFYSQAKDSFIANISHEIKTPINAILGMVHFLKSTRLSQNQKELVRKIETSSDILLTIISDVLDLSKIKSNTLSLYPSDFSLEMIIKNVEDMFSNQLAYKRIEWRTDYDFNKNLCLHLDKTRFVQVLVNLINNACKFTDNGYIKLSVETLSENEEMVLLQFCVEDTGIGIAEKDISKLFHEFEQLENHLTKQHQGTGLGLFICKNIVESMDGRLWVESTKGQGSKFYFSLSAKKSLEPKLGPATSIINTIPLDGNGGKALVVEDTEINAEVAVKLLNDVNIACDTVADGLSALEMCKSKPADYYNVILMDIHMPNMDGYTAAQILKKEMAVTSPIIALTASDINDQIRSEHAETIEAFILKPFKAAAFYKAITPYFPNQDENMLHTGPKKHVDRKGTEEGSEGKQDHAAAHTGKSQNAVRDPFAGRENAIKNLGGLESIYYKHVEKFKNNYVDSTEHIAALLAENNIDEARRLAHSIKGLGGTLGMLDVMEASSELEKAILKGKDYDLTVELENFDTELKAAIDAI
jgi:signal transduction histidine kinase/DNA-binding NarL/FixJ family response regulator/HPt (histidine-containing phosphotransfer) domain-containing protein